MAHFAYANNYDVQQLPIEVCNCLRRGFRHLQQKRTHVTTLRLDGQIHGLFPGLHGQRNRPSHMAS